MAKLTTYALAGALAFALAPVAGYAADLPEPPLLEPTPEPVEFGSAWYIRGDVGYKSYRDPKIHYNAKNFPGDGDFKGEKIKDAAVFGGGVGYKLSEHFRTDVTLDYETKARLRGDLDSDIKTCGLKQCGSHERAKIDAWTLFWNGYVDIATIGGFTPYVGGGIGVARLGISDYTTRGYAGCTKFCGPDSFDKDHKWNFAWNLQAGAAFAISENLLIDANYRFVDLGNAEVKVDTGNKGKVKIHDVQAHEVRVGFRYMID